MQGCGHSTATPAAGPSGSAWWTQIVPEFVGARIRTCPSGDAKDNWESDKPDIACRLAEEERDWKEAEQLQSNES